MDNRQLNQMTASRQGAVLPLFALILPVLFVLVAFAINMAYLQLVSTEIKIAADAAAHAGGRAMSILQTTEAAHSYARANAQLNSVGGEPLTLSILEDDDIEFGLSVRADNGYGRYEFSSVTTEQVNNGTQRATSIAVTASADIPLIFSAMPGMANVTASKRSIATQVDRDIALVLDRSGSMLYYRDDQALTDQLYDLYNTWEEEVVEGHYKYGYWRYKNGRWRWKGYYKISDANSSWWRDQWDYYWVDGYSNSYRAISWDEYENATEGLYDRQYSNNVIDKLNDVNTEMSAYASDWEYSSEAPRYSRWYYLDLGVTAFLDVLDVTDQNELCSLVTFASSASKEFELQSDYTAIRNKVASIVPYGGTAIGDGMEEGLPLIIDGEDARVFAAKTIVVLTDGENNSGKDPVSAVEDIVDTAAVTIHTVTFSPGADKDAMSEVATMGGGRHYHADDGSALIEIFEEIANNLPTVLTE